MTPEQRTDIERALSYPGARVALQCDQYEVDLVVKRDKLKMFIVIYVGGEWRGKWLLEDCEERRRFMRPVTRTVRMKPELERALGKKWVREHAKYTCFAPYWASVKSLLRHLEKHNVSVTKREAATA